MQATKKVSATEFRIHNKLSYVNYIPSNYFKAYRFEIILQQLLNWFFTYYGIYLYIQKIKIINEIILIQLYYYKTYLYKKALYRNRRRKAIINNILFDVFKLLIRHKKNKRDVFYKHKYKRSKIVKKINITKKLNKNKKRKIVPFVYNHPTRITFVTRRRKLVYLYFLKVFFFYFYGVQARIIFKSLFKYFFRSKPLRKEHKLLAARTRYLVYYKWSYDLLFLMNYGVTFANTNFILPYFVYHAMILYERHIDLFRNFFNILRALYILKGILYGIRLIIHGTYVRKDRYGRSRTLVYKIKNISLTRYQSFILYDIIQCPTRFATISLKLWLLYKKK